MPAASFTRELKLAASPGSCWATLIEVPTLVSWVSVLHEGREVEPLQHYTAVLMDKLGPFKLKASLDITLSDVQPGSLARLRAAGEDRQVGSRISVDTWVRLAEHDGGTLLSVDGRYEVAGRVATLGAAAIRKKADRLLAEFFGNLQRALG